MSTRLQQRSNSEWIAALKSERADSSTLVEELSGFVQRVLGSTLSSKSLDSDVIADLSQESMLQLVRSLDTFRGDSAFTTWVAAVATRTAYTELSRRAARDAKHESFQRAQEDALTTNVEAPATDGDSSTTRDHVLRSLYQSIDSELTDRQRIATLALLRGVPTVEIAEQLGSKTNAVYKLVHDARVQLRGALNRRGISGQQIEDMMEGQAAQ